MTDLVLVDNQSSAVVAALVTHEMGDCDVEVQLQYTLERQLAEFGLHGQAWLKRSLHYSHSAFASTFFTHPSHATAFTATPLLGSSGLCAAQLTHRQVQQTPVCEARPVALHMQAAWACITM